MRIQEAVRTAVKEEVDLIFRHHQVSMLHETQTKYKVNIYFSQQEICTLGNQRKKKLTPVKAGSSKGLGDEQKGEERTPK